MSLSDAGNWASIIGFVITILTFLLAARVNHKVNGILKTKQDRTYFQKRAKGTIQNLSEIKSAAEEDNTEVLFSTKQYSKINDAMELVSSSWDILLRYENKLSRKLIIHSWNKKFERVRQMYRSERIKSVKEMITFLGAFITFFEKEMDDYE